MSGSGKRDKAKHETMKKPAHTLKEKRKLKHEKHQPHPAEVVEKLHERERHSPAAKST